VTLLTLEECKRLIALSDNELARVGNRYSYKPKVLIVSKGRSREVEPEETSLGEGFGKVARTFLDAWSDPKSTLQFLKRKLGVVFISDGSRENQTDGECDNIFGIIKNDEIVERFRNNDNYYNFECFIPVLRWALQKRIEELGG